jgi:intein/homing endonuclease
MVSTPTGDVPIETLKIGDAVLGFRYGKIVEGRVVSTRNKVKPTIILDAGGKVECTLDHRFYIGSGKYKQAKNLRAGDTIYRKNENGLYPVKIATKSNILTPKQVFTIGVEKIHNFFANNFAVHNLLSSTTSCYIDAMGLTVTYSGVSQVDTLLVLGA